MKKKNLYQEQEFINLKKHYPFYGVKLATFQFFPKQLKVQKPKYYFKFKQTSPIHQILQSLKKKHHTSKHNEPLIVKNQLHETLRTSKQIKHLREISRDNTKLITQLKEGRNINVKLSNSNRFLFSFHNSIEIDNFKQHKQLEKQNKNEIQSLEKKKSQEKIYRRRKIKFQGISTPKQRVKKYQEKLLLQLTLSSQSKENLKKQFSKIIKKF